MNNDTIKAALGCTTDHTSELDYVNIAAFIAGAEYMQAQKDEQIKELVEGMINIINDISPSSITYDHWETSDFLDGIIFWKSVPSDRRIIECIKLIQKYKG